MTRATISETPTEALDRIRKGFSRNDVAVIVAFAEAGIDPDDIDPRQNVLTFHAWKAAGRRVAKGATSLRVPVWVPRAGRSEAESTSVEPAATSDGSQPKRSGGLIAKTAKLFHISQTIPIDERGTRPDAWRNENLIKAGTYEDESESEIDNAASDETQQETDAACICPMVGVMEDVCCPLHGTESGQLDCRQVQHA